jgi:hypothetical protein
MEPSAEPWTDVSGKPVENTLRNDFGFEIHVAPDLMPLLKPLADFTPHPRNFRKHKLDAIAESMREHGVQSPLVVQRSTGYVCKGNGSYKAAVALGIEQYPVSVEDFDDERAWKYLLADNRASDLASYEGDLLVQELQKLVDSGDFQGTLWTPDDADDMLAEAGAVQHTQLGEFKGGYAETPEQAEARKAAAKQSGAKLREVPVTMSVEQHTRFMAALKVLQKAYGTKGTIATIIETVFRAAAELETSGKAAAGFLESAEQVFEGEVAKSTPEAEPEPTVEELTAKL